MIVGAGAVIENYWISLAFMAASIVFVALEYFFTWARVLCRSRRRSCSGGCSKKRMAIFNGKACLRLRAGDSRRSYLLYSAGRSGKRQGRHRFVSGWHWAGNEAGGRWLNPRLERLLGSGDGDDDEFCGEAVIEPEPFED